MTDFHDLHTLSTTFTFDGQTLAEAIRATFKQSGTELPIEEVPLAFTAGCCEDENSSNEYLSNNSIALLPKPVFNNLDGAPLHNITMICPIPKSIAFWHSFSTVRRIIDVDIFVSFSRIRS